MPLLILALSLIGAAGSAQTPAEPEKGWDLGPGLELSHAEAGFRVSLRGALHGDLVSRRNFTDGDDEDEGLNGTETELRRARIGIDGQWGRLGFQAQVDPTDEGDELKDLYGELRIVKALRIRAGQFKVPVSREFLSSISRGDFVERSMVVTNLAPSRDWGVMISGSPFKRFDYMVGVFEGDGRTRRTRADRTVAARIDYGILESLDVGASFSEGEVEAFEQEGVEAVPRGLPGVGASRFRFYDAHFVDGRRRRLGADVRWSGGPFGINGEWLQATEERLGQGATFDDLPTQIGQGWAASATWLVTGEKKTRTFKPSRSLSKGGPGAIELAVRFESLHFDDEGDDTGFPGAGNRARNIRPAEARAFTGGLSWWPESFLRLLGNVVVEHFEDELLAPEPGRQGQYVTILGRLQFQLP